jgi:ABC-type uncharacterized transport system auxiliary subunit
MFRATLVIAAILLLAACTTSSPVPEDRFYQLELATPGQVFPSPVLQGGLEIDYTEADPLRSGRAVLYSENAQPLQLKRYHYAYWVDQPPRLVHRQLVQYLRASGIVDRVDDGGQHGTTAYRLKTHVLKFEQLRGGPAPEVVVELEASLERLPAGSVLWTSVYSQRQASGGDNMHATAEAMHKALEQVLHTLSHDLSVSAE